MVRQKRHTGDDCTETSTCVSCRRACAASQQGTETTRGQTRIRQATLAEDQAKPAAVRPKVGGQPREQQEIQTATQTQTLGSRVFSELIHTKIVCRECLEENTYLLKPQCSVHNMHT